MRSEKTKRPTLRSLLPSPATTALPARRYSRSASTSACSSRVQLNGMRSTCRSVNGGDLAGRLRPAVELGLEPAHHHELDLATLVVGELRRLAEPDRVEHLEQPGEAGREPVVRGRREEEPVLGVLGDVGEHPRAVGALAEPERREVVRLVDDEQIPRERVAALEPLRAGEEVARGRPAGAGSPST